MSFELTERIVSQNETSIYLMIQIPVKTIIPNFYKILGYPPLKKLDYFWVLPWIAHQFPLFKRIASTLAGPDYMANFSPG